MTKNSPIEAKEGRLAKLRAEVEKKRKAAKLKNQRARVKEWLKVPIDIHMYDHDLKAKIPTDIGVGYEFEHDGKKWITAVSMPRTVRLEITSYCGISPGAIHYYGKLHLDRPWFVQPGVESGVHSWFGTDDLPPHVSFDIVELTRALRESDFSPRLGDRFEGYKVGDRQYTFNTPEQVKRRAKFIFKKWFEPGWKYKDDNDYD